MRFAKSVYYSLLVIGLLHLATAKAEEFKVQGQFEFAALGQQRTNYYSIAKFEVNVKGGLWRIEAAPVTAKFSGIIPQGVILSEEPVIQRFVASFDGQNIYSFSESKGKEGGAEIMNAAIEQGPVPYDIDGSLSMLWMAFCSGSYLSNLPDKLVDPFAGWDYGKEVYSDKHKLVGEWSFLSGKKGLPKSVILFQRDSANAQASVAGINGKTNLIYAIQAYTNAIGSEFPLKFGVTIFRSDNDGGRIPVLVLLGNVTNIMADISAAPFIPVLGKTTYILDKRPYKMNPPARSIRIDSGLWPSVEKMNQTYSKIIQPKISKESNPKGSSRMRFFLVLALFATSGILIVILTKRTKKTV